MSESKMRVIKEAAIGGLYVAFILWQCAGGFALGWLAYEWLGK